MNFIRHHFWVCTAVLLSHLLALLAIASNATAVPPTQTPPAMISMDVALLPAPVATPAPAAVSASTDLKPAHTNPTPKAPSKPPSKPEPKPVRAEPKMASPRKAAATAVATTQAQATPVESVTATPSAPHTLAATPSRATATAPSTSTDTIQQPSTMATAVGNKAPRYPQLSRKKKEQGTVLLLLLVKADGRVGELQVKVSSGYPRLDQAALQAVKNWQFNPARQGQQAIDYWYELPIHFSLNP